MAIGKHVFLCYAHEDKEFVLRLAASLKARDVSIWLDLWGIPPGADWDGTIDCALDECAQLLIVLSPAAVKSKEVRGELRAALNANKAVVPILYQACMIPRQLQLIQYVDFTSCGPNDEATLGNVVRALRGEAPMPSQFAEVPENVLAVGDLAQTPSGHPLSAVEYSAQLTRNGRIPTRDQGKRKSVRSRLVLIILIVLAIATPLVLYMNRDESKQTLAGTLPVAYSPDGKILATMSPTRPGPADLKLWDAQTGDLKQTVRLGRELHALVFSPDGKLLASGGRFEALKLWDVQSGKLNQTLRQTVDSVAFSPDGKMLASASEDGTVKEWDVQTGALKQTLTGINVGPYSVAFSPDGKILASGASYGVVNLWDVQSSALKQTLIVEGSPTMYSLAFSPDGKTLASAGSGPKVELWDVQTGGSKQTLIGHSEGVSSVAFSPDGKTLASGGYNDKTIKLWDLETGALKQTLIGHSDGVGSVAFSPDGKTLASGSYDKTVKLWAVKESR